MKRNSSRAILKYIIEKYTNMEQQDFEKAVFEVKGGKWVNSNNLSKYYRRERPLSKEKLETMSDILKIDYSYFAEKDENKNCYLLLPWTALNEIKVDTYFSNKKSVDAWNQVDELQNAILEENDIEHYDDILRNTIDSAIETEKVEKNKNDVKRIQSALVCLLKYKEPYDIDISDRKIDFLKYILTIVLINDYPWERLKSIIDEELKKNK